MDATKEGENYTTMRSLLALIRMAQARARLRFSNEISKEDVTDCLELIEESQKSVLSGRLDRKKKETDETLLIWNIIKALCSYSRTKETDIDMIRKRALARGHS